MNELFYLFVIGISINTVLFLYDIRIKNYKRIYSYLLFGSLGGLLDLIVECAGTYNEFWTYNESIFFLFELVPIELPALFFSAVVIGKFLQSTVVQKNNKINTNLLFSLFSILGFMLYLYANIFLKVDDTLIVFTLPIGLWGFQTFKNESQKNSLLLIALFVAIIDFYIETWIISSGNYNYSAGLKLITPVNYFLLTLAMFGLMQAVDLRNKNH